MMRFHDYPKQLEEHYIRRLRETYMKRAQILADISSPEEARIYQQRIRAVISEAFGPLPVRTPLNARVWRSSDHGAYRIEHLSFESRPGFWVTANIYLPVNVGGPVPGVIFACGHSAVGKAAAGYVQACLRLVHEGYAVLIYDPINQGERELYSPDQTNGRLSRERPCSGHNIIGRQLHACGDWLGSWRLWDGLRAVDYLAGRAEVDEGQLALTGNSGGGTLSAYMWSMDSRFRAVASSCWCTSYLHDLENSMPADDEQYPPGFLAAGLDKVDFFMARAGEPTLLLGQEYDFFDDRGLRQAHRELLRIHQLLGGGDEQCVVDLDCRIHGYSDYNQRAMLAFFNQVFMKPPRMSIHLIGYRPSRA